MIKKEVIIGDCRLLLGDCLEIMPTLDKVDAVVDNSDDVVFNSDYENTADRQRCTPNKSSTNMGASQGRDNVSLHKREQITSGDGEDIQYISSGISESNSANGDSSEIKGEAREAEREIHRRGAKHSLQKDDRENPLQQVRISRSTPDPSHRRDSHEQCKEQSGSSLLTLPHKSPQTRVVGQEKISILTDPPYGIGIDGQKENIKGKKSDRKGFAFKGWDNETPTHEIFNLMFAMSDEQIIWGGNYFQDKINKVGRGWLLWDKDQHGLTMSDGELAYCSLSMPLRIFKKNRSILKKDGTQHPTQKPVDLMKWCLGFLSKNNIILDPFMGSGTTGVACAKLGRKFIGIELDEDYFNIACERIRKAYQQPDLFVEPPKTMTQETLI